MSWSIVYRGGGSNTTITPLVGSGVFTGAAPSVSNSGNSYPDATNTGVPTGTSLTSAGSITTSSNNQVIEEKDISGGITVSHSGVIIRKCRITVPWGQNGISHGSSAASDMIVEDCEIVGEAYAPNGWAYNGIDAEFGGTILRCNVHRFENCIFYSSPGYGGLMEDCYLWDPYPITLWDGHTGGGDGPHVDTFQAWAGMTDLTVRHNTIFADSEASSDMTWGSDNANILIEDNLFTGGCYTLRIGESGSCGTNIQIINNKFSTAVTPLYGIWSVGTNSGRSGNTYYPSGSPVGDGD